MSWRLVDQRKGHPRFTDLETTRGGICRYRQRRVRENFANRRGNCSALAETEQIGGCPPVKPAVRASGSWRQMVIGFPRDIGLQSSTFAANPVLAATTRRPMEPTRLPIRHN